MKCPNCGLELDIREGRNVCPDPECGYSEGVRLFQKEVERILAYYADAEEPPVPVLSSRLRRRAAHSRWGGPFILLILISKFAKILLCIKAENDLKTY